MQKKGMPDLYTYFVPANASPAAGKMLGRMVQEMFMHFMPRCLMHALIEYDLMQMLPLLGQSYVLHSVVK